ncbi:5-oxoprolinase subunit B family protein [Kitasatospora kifunensis]|uniref:KipI family sensor histidine kinase inhibitor n=1 Tax=Kitasatospora kifunensis TaxID=58351 RepID=A0A7W7QX34_KITKI|nr:allophanate hydrolase subunit 1 [Kitasatospora kifunensis]MBB4921128.1 KipI family sensor histidine kinase inhibitor [Kitasatospora kifunensis]
MRALPVGLDALLIELDSPQETAALHAELLRLRAASRLPPVREIVPAARTVLLDGLDDPRGLARELVGRRVPPLPPTAGEVITIPVRYDGEDLSTVAALWGVREEEVAHIHSAAHYRVAFGGFAPGFGYLTGLGEQYHVPRRAVPRTAVPAGSIALAGAYTGIYPRSSPGGWQLIGSTDAVLWDPGREPAALFAPGARVRFVIAGGREPADGSDADGSDADGSADTEGAAGR